MNAETKPPLRARDRPYGATATPASARILVAAENADTAAQVIRQLSGDYSRMSASTDLASAVSDFEAFQPDVVVLAFDSIEKAQRYSIVLYRQSQFINSHPHRTVLLCNKTEVPEAFDLCKKDCFDDYVQHWPLAYDGRRLMMSIWVAARDLMTLAVQPSAECLSDDAADLDAIDAVLARQQEQGVRNVAMADKAVRGIEASVQRAIDEFSGRLIGADASAVVDVKNEASLAQEVDRLKHGQLRQAFQAGAERIAQVADSPRKAQCELAAHVAKVRRRASEASSLRPSIMVVDDDDVQRELIGATLHGEPYDVSFAIDGASFLGALRRRRPDLILMDVNLPGRDGLTLTRTLKGMPYFAQIPVLMLTGEARRETLDESMRAGAADFIVKPFNRHTLLAKLDRLLPVGT